MKKLCKEFARAIQACEDEYNRHYPKKRDSWRRMPIEELEGLVEKAIDDYFTGEESNDLPQLIDIINLALMVVERTIQQEGGSE
jgi:hypothetical protein